MNFKPNHKASVLLTALSIFISACQQNSEVQSNNHPKQVDNIIDQTNKLLTAGKPKKAYNYLDSAFKSLSNPGPADLWKNYNQKTNYFLNYEIDTKKAKNYTDSMFYVLNGREKVYKMEYAHTLFSTGDVLMAEKRYTEAFQKYYSGRNYARLHLDSCSFSHFTYKLGLVKYRQKQYLQAIPYLKQALEENNHCKADAGFDNTFIIPQSLNNTIALAFERGSSPDSAIFYYQRGLAFIDETASRFPEKKTDITIARGVFYGNLGGVLAKKSENYGLAEKYLKKSIHINNKPGYAVEDAQTAELKLVNLYLKMRRFEDAELWLKELEKGLAAREGNNWNNDLMDLNWYKLNQHYFERTGQTNKAYTYLKKYEAKRDSINQVDKGLAQLDMDAVFLNTEQQYKMELINKRDQLKTVYLVAAIIFSIMAITILLLVGHNLNRSRKNVKRLTGLNREISEHNIQMQEALEALQQSQEENTHMMQIVAHDLRNPVSSMIMIASLMLKSSWRSEEDYKLLQMIKVSGNDSIALISDLMKTHVRQVELKKDPVDISQMLHYCVDLLNHKATAKQQHIILDAPNITLPLNREKMWRVISNLIANAIKFSPTGNIIKVNMEIFPVTIRISVQDQGIGIPDEMKDKIFEMLGNATRPGTAGEQSFGLGLAISRQIVSAHQGRIWFESKTNNGTTFFVELPRE